MPKNSAKRKNKRILTATACVLFALVFVAMSTLTVFAAGDVSSAIQSTWTSAQTQIKNVVNNVVFPVKAEITEIDKYEFQGEVL